MEKLKCRFCDGGDLVEMNGTYHCWNCGAKYVKENGELRLLKCKLCIGDLIDCGDHYECDLCGEKYEKAVPKKEVSAPAPKPELDSQNPQEEEKIGWEELLDKGCDALYDIGLPTLVVNLEYAKACFSNIIILIGKNEPEENINHAFNKFVTEFLGAFYHAYLYFGFKLRDYPESRKSVLGSLDESIALCLRAIFIGTGNVLYTKMITERAYGLFSSISENSKILENIEIFEEVVGDQQKEINALYWEEHSKEFKELTEERNYHCRIIREYKELLDKAEAAKQETEKIRSEISGVRDCYHRAWNRSIRLNFFQKKEKKKLEKEMHLLVVSENNLKEKLKLCEKEEKKLTELVEKEREKANCSYTRVYEIDFELDANHCPGEEEFVEMFERKIRKVEDNFGKK